MKKLLYLFILLLTLGGLVLPSRSVYALSQDRAIQGEGGETNGVYYVGGAPGGSFNNLNSNDGATSVLQTSTPPNPNSHCYDTDNFTASYSSIDGVTMTFVWESGDVNGYIRPYVRIGGTNYYGNVKHPAAILVFQTDTENHFGSVTNANPATGLAWTASDINNAEWGVIMTVWYSGLATTYLKITVNYTLVSMPTVTTSAATSLTTTSATLNGDITDDGGASITNYGFVWDTSSHSDPGNTVPPATYSTNWTAGSGTVEGAITHATGGVLVLGTTYYVRAFAQNSAGWAYGDEETFSTIGNPSIATLAATNVASTTATLNANVSNDGGEACTVRFAYADNTSAPYADYSAVLAAGTEVLAVGTYTTGETPSYNISSLSTSHIYYFSCNVTNTASSQVGSVLSFTTTSGVGTPTNLVALPASTSISVSWTKGTGAPYTVLRYSSGGYPLTYADGISAYIGMNTSTSLTGLTAGTNYYFAAWGLNAGVYSSSNVTAMCTTLAYDTSTTTNVTTLLPPASNSAWIQTPSAVKVANIPLVGQLVQDNSTAYSVPINWLWYFLWVLGTTGLGVIVYNSTGRYNLVAASSVDGVLYVFGAILGLTSLWALVVIAIIVMGFGLWGLRY